MLGPSEVQLRWGDAAGQISAAWASLYGLGNGVEGSGSPRGALGPL